MTYVLVFAGLVVLALVAASVFSRRAPELGLVDGRLRPCPSSPNCVASEEVTGDRVVEPLAFEGDPKQALADLRALVEEMAGATVREATADYLHAEFRTSILRFVDDVEFRVDAADGVIHLRSASRVGHSDLGQNRRRAEAIRRAWESRPG